MKTNPLIAWMSAGLACLLLGACQANEQFEQFASLTNRDWQLVGEWQDDSLVVEACQLDDVLSFVEEQAFLLDFGAEFCASFESLGPRSGTWKFYDAGQALHFRYREHMANGRVSIKRSWEVELIADTLWLWEAVFDETNPGGRVSQRYLAVN